MAYDWTAPTTGTFVIDTFNSEIDTWLEVLDGDCSGASLACNDQYGDGDTSLVTVSLTAGDTITIILGAYFVEADGAVQLNIEAESAF